MWNNLVMPLQPRDVVIALKIVVWEEGPWTYESLADSLSIAVSRVHAGVKRLEAARLVDPLSRLARRYELLEFLTHGVRYAFYPELTAVVRGVPTAISAPPLDSALRSSDIDYVWPDPEGTVRGQGMKPLDASVVKSVRRDSRFYALLALVDAIRVGQPRERTLASSMLRELVLGRYSGARRR